MRSNMAFKVVDRLFLVMYGTERPTDEEWGVYLKLVTAHAIDRTMQLIFTDGGEPSAHQRRVLNDLLKGRIVPVAVVSCSARVRGTVMALSWFNRKIRAFPPSALRDAIAYLEIPLSRQALIEREMAELRLKLGLPMDAPLLVEHTPASGRPPHRAGLDAGRHIRAVVRRLHLGKPGRRDKVASSYQRPRRGAP